MKKGIIILAILSLVTVSKGQAEEKLDLKPKSIGTAVLLGLDPIPGDALFYAGKSGQGAINLVLGGLGGFAFWGSIISLSSCAPDDGLCGLNAIPMMAGAALYFPMLAWDLIGGVSGVRSHNEKIAQKLSWLKTVQPTLSVSDKGAMAGIQIRF